MSRFLNAGAQSRALILGGGLFVGAVLIGALTILVALAGLRRLGDDTDLLTAAAWLWYYRFDPEVARWTRLGLLTSGLSVTTIAFSIMLNIRRPLHGAARWARAGELRRGGLRSREGILLGIHGRRLMVFGGPEHVMLYAPTRTGKGVGVVIPNLLSWPHSLIVLDIKRENWAASAGFRAAHGQDVLLFDPFAADGATARFNPLGHIDRSDSSATLDELQKIAMMLIPTSEHSDPFWSEAARTGFIGVGALVAETSELPLTLGEILRQLTTGVPRARLQELVVDRARSARPLSSGCVSALGDFCSASENTFSSIRQTITSRLGLFLNPRVDWATAASDFDLAEIKSRPTSLYLGVSPDNLSRVAPLYNLLLQQFIDLNTRGLPSHDNSKPILVVLDEFARLGHAHVIARGFSFVAGYGIRLLAVLQSPSQLRAEYGPDLADEIIGNCGVEIVFAPKDVRVAQTLSERLGYYGAPAQSHSRPFGLANGRHSITQSDQRRALMLPQELIGLSQDELIVLRASLPPIRGRKLCYYRNPEFRHRVLAPPKLRPRMDTFSAPPGQPYADAQGREDAIDASPVNREAAVRAWTEAVLDRDLKAPPPHEGRSKS